VMIVPATPRKMSYLEPSDLNQAWIMDR
jgi:hypothetical protein